MILFPESHFQNDHTHTHTFWFPSNNQNIHTRHNPKETAQHQGCVARDLPACWGEVFRSTVAQDPNLFWFYSVPKQLTSFPTSQVSYSERNVAIWSALLGWKLWSQRPEHNLWILMERKVSAHFTYQCLSQPAVQRQQNPNWNALVYKTSTCALPHMTR